MWARGAFIPGKENRYQVWSGEKAITLEGEEAERRLERSAGARVHSGTPRHMAEGIHEHLARLAAGLSLVKSSLKGVQIADE